MPEGRESTEQMSMSWRAGDPQAELSRPTQLQRHAAGLGKGQAFSMTLMWCGQHH